MVQYRLQIVSYFGQYFYSYRELARRRPAQMFRQRIRELKPTIDRYSMKAHYGVVRHIAVKKARRR